MEITITINSSRPEELVRIATALANLEGFASTLTSTPTATLDLTPPPVSTPVEQVPAVPTTTPTPTPVTSAPATVPTSAPQYTMEQLAVAATQLVDAGRRTELVALLNSFGVQALTALPKEQYGAFATQLRAMGAKI